MLKTGNKLHKEADKALFYQFLNFLRGSLLQWANQEIGMI
jgi:hypothetical protein